MRIQVPSSKQTMTKTNNHVNSSMRSSFSLLKEIQDSTTPSNSTEPCQICGDVGDKSLIMTCFHCRESREHTYCTEVSLPSVPDIWICRECRTSSRMLQTSTVRDARIALASNRVINCTLGPENSNRSEKSSCNHVEEAPLRSSVSDSFHGIVANSDSEHHPQCILQAHTNTEGEEGCLKLKKFNPVNNCTVGPENSNSSERSSCNHVEEAPLRASVSDSCHGIVANSGSDHYPRLILQAHTNPEGDQTYLTREEGCLKLNKTTRRKNQRPPVHVFLPPKKKREPLQFRNRKETFHEES